MGTVALDDANLKKEDVDGLLINANMSPGMSPLLQMTLGFENLSLLNVMNAYGSTAGTMIQYACMAIQEGLANFKVAQAKIFRKRWLFPLKTLIESCIS